MLFYLNDKQAGERGKYIGRDDVRVAKVNCLTFTRLSRVSSEARVDQR